MTPGKTCFPAETTSKLSHTLIRKYRNTSQVEKQEVCHINLKNYSYHLGVYFKLTVTVCGRLKQLITNQLKNLAMTSGVCRAEVKGRQNMRTISTTHKLTFLTKIKLFVTDVK